MQRALHTDCHTVDRHGISVNEGVIGMWTDTHVEAVELVRQVAGLGLAGVDQAVGDRVDDGLNAAQCRGDALAGERDVLRAQCKLDRQKTANYDQHSSNSDYCALFHCKPLQAQATLREAGSATCGGSKLRTVGNRMLRNGSTGTVKT